MGKKCLWGCIGFAAFMLAACGEDSAGTNSIEKNDETSDKDGTVQVEDFDDLPNCTEKREGMEASTESGNKYICEDGEWKEPDSDVLTYETEDDLPNCTEKREGVTARIEETGETYTCNDGEWVEEGSTPPSDDDPGEEDDGESGHDSSSSNKVATEDDLPNCTKAREGEKVWVEELEEYLVCKSKSWVAADDDEESESSSSGKSKSSSSGTADSSDSVGSSSSNGSGDSSSASGSSSSTSGSSSASSSAKIRGVCTATPNIVEKGELVIWNFTSLTPEIDAVTFNWTFDEGTSRTSSVAASPSVSYSTPNQTTGYGAKLVVNKGTDTESAEITCTNKVMVVPTNVTGCQCTTSQTTTIATPSSPQNITYSVSGCEGASPFTYAWSNGASGTGASATVSIASGSVTPKVTVTNSDGMTMSPTCPTVTAVGAKCKLSNTNSSYSTYYNPSINTIPNRAVYFMADSVTGVSGSMNMTLTWGDSSKSIPISASSSYNVGKVLTTPSELGVYPVTLSIDGNVICSAVMTVEWPEITASCSFSNAVPGGSAYFDVTSISGWTDALENNIVMTLEDENGVGTNVTINKSGSSNLKVSAPAELGSYRYTLKYRGNTVCTANMPVIYPRPSCNLGLGEYEASSSSVSAIPEQTVYFKPGNSVFTYSDSIRMDLTLNGTTKSIIVKPNINYATALTAPSELGTYPVTLSYEDNQVCSATLKVEWPLITSTSCEITNGWGSNGTNYYFTPGASFSNWNTSIPQQLDMVLYLDDTIIRSASVNRYYNGRDWMQITLPTEPGHIYRLDFHGNTVCTVSYSP